MGLVSVDELSGDAGLSLANISTRAVVADGQNKEIAGFIIQGTENLKVLVKAAGKGLQAYGLATELDPQIEVVRMSDGVTVGQNDNWNDDARAAEIPEAQRPVHEQDAALVLDLAPGAYTAVVSPVSGSGEVGLVSVDVLP